MLMAACSIPWARASHRQIFPKSRIIIIASKLIDIFYGNISGDDNGGPCQREAFMP